MYVNFKRMKVITVTEIANTVRNPVFIPKIKKRMEVISPGLPADKLKRSIFSGEAKRGTLKTAFAKNKQTKKQRLSLHGFEGVEILQE